MNASLAPITTNRNASAPIQELLTHPIFNQGVIVLQPDGTSMLLRLSVNPYSISKAPILSRTVASSGEGSSLGLAAIGAGSISAGGALAAGAGGLYILSVGGGAATTATTTGIAVTAAGAGTLGVAAGAALLATGGVAVAGGVIVVGAYGAYKGYQWLSTNGWTFGEAQQKVKQMIQECKQIKRLFVSAHNACVQARGNMRQLEARWIANQLASQERNNQRKNLIAQIMREAKHALSGIDTVRQILSNPAGMAGPLDDNSSVSTSSNNNDAGIDIIHLITNSANGLQRIIPLLTNLDAITEEADSESLNLIRATSRLITDGTQQLSEAETHVTTMQELSYDFLAIANKHTAINIAKNTGTLLLYHVLTHMFHVDPTIALVISITATIVVNVTPGPVAKVAGRAAVAALNNS